MQNEPIYPPTDGDIFIAAGSFGDWIVRLTSWKQIARQQLEWREADQSARPKRPHGAAPPFRGPIRERNGNQREESVLRSEGVRYEVGYYCSNFSIT